MRVRCIESNDECDSAFQDRDRGLSKEVGLKQITEQNKSSAAGLKRMGECD